MHAALLAYVLRATVLAWGLVQCQEPGGRVAIELVGDHSQCGAPIAPGHGHDAQDEPGGSPGECDHCTFCPCIDVPVGVAAAALSKRTAPLDPATVLGPPGPASAERASGGLSLAAAERHAAAPDRVTQRCLRTVVLLV